MKELVEFLRSSGYRYMIVPVRNRKRFLATKAQLNGPDFRSDDLFDEYTVETASEQEFYNMLQKGVFYKL